MRLGMFRLLGVIAQQLSQPMAKGCFFLFINKPHTLLKAVWFDGTGLCLFCKRLEQGQFSWPQTATMSDENGCKFNHLSSRCFWMELNWKTAWKKHGMKYNFLVKSKLLLYNRARERLWNSAIGVTFFFWGKGPNAGEFQPPSGTGKRVIARRKWHAQTHAFRQEKRKK